MSQLHRSVGDTTERPSGTIRDLVEFSADRRKKFNIRSLPADLQRIYKYLEKEFGDEYALTMIFTIRTAVELHRAWHMTLLTSKILQQLKDRFRLRLTWNLSVFQLEFRIQDGGTELYRRAPYDYDSEYQDIYMRTAVALMDGRITVHEALLFQSETLEGKHTARSGLFLRDFPGRLVLYPLVASTCAVVFFSGDWTDFYIAALCGLASGMVEWCLAKLHFGILTDVTVGTSTGMIAGFFYRYNGREQCLSAIFLGTLYWFFYGTAFVIGIVEIIAGDLQTGVTRFIAVSVKTFVLCLGAAFGLQVVGDASGAWYEQQDNCGRINLDGEWWRIPLYILCSVAVLGQYRFPIVRYWRALIVMVVGYEVQYEFFNYFAGIHQRDNLDTATSNVFGSAGAVVSACAVSYYVNKLRYYFDGRILQENKDDSCIGKFIYKFMACGVYFADILKLGRSSDRLKLDMEKKLSQARRELKDPTHARREIKLEPAEENLIIETIVGCQDMNIWSILMPALYQLVPGSLIAKLWFNYIFPPPLIETTQEIPGISTPITTYEIDEAANSVFSGLMIVSTSLALGLLIGFALVATCEKIFEPFGFSRDKLKNNEEMERAKSRRHGMYSAPGSKEDDPQSVATEFRKVLEHGVTTEAEADAIFNVIDVDLSNSIDQGEVTEYMLLAGLTADQVQKLFASMDADGNGEVSRAEFRRAVLDKSNASLLQPKEEAQPVPIATKEEATSPTNTVPLVSGEYGSSDGGIKAGKIEEA